MKVTPAIAAAPLLLLLLTWLSLRAINSDAELFDHALAALDRFAVAENALHRDVLSARAGLLRNYDPLVQEVGALHRSLDRLRETTIMDSESSTIDRLAAVVDRQEELVERFKSDNALLQNSLAYFGLYSTRLCASQRRVPPIPAVGALTTAILQLTLDTSPDAAREVDSRLNELAKQPPPSDDPMAFQPLLAHGRLLHDLLPATDGILKALFAEPDKPAQDAVRSAILAHQKASRANARRFRMMLYGASLLMLALLIHLGLRLRARTLSLQRRAAFEHMIAGVSMHLINAQPHEIDEHVEQALAQMAQSVHADRAYFMVASPSPKTHIWCQLGTSSPPGWPSQSLALAARFRPTADGIIHIPRVSRLPSGEDRDACTALGLKGWACISVLGADGISRILGFESLRQPCRSPQSSSGILAVLRMALDVVANGIQRQFLEQEKARLETQLQQARRLETVGALASGIAHNFNNIVGAILGYAEMAEAHLTPDSRAARNLAEIRRAGERARDLIDHLLTFGRRHEVRRRPMSVQAMVSETTSLLQASLPPTIKLMVRVAPEAAVVSGEPAQLQQVILNLCSNAAQAMDGTGRVEIDLELHKIAQRQPLTHGTLAPGRYVRIAVNDSGRGMDEEMLEHIFEPFFTTRMTGRGLGLATVREIVREHGGAINVLSAPGVGSRFEIWLPCIASAAAPDNRVPALPLGHGDLVMVVDDDHERLLRDEEMLAALGYEPVGFMRGAEALAACQAEPKRFDAAVIVHLAPASAALDLAASLHGMVPDMPILLATAPIDEIGANRLVAASISDIVRRPLVSTEIASALMRCLAKPQTSVGGLRA